MNYIESILDLITSFIKQNSKEIIGALGGLIGIIWKWRSERTKNKKEKIFIATTLYESIKEIENYVKSERGSANIRISHEWESVLGKCNFLSEEERCLVREIHVTAEKFHDSYKERGKPGCWGIWKDDFPGYNDLKNIFFKNYSTYKGTFYEYNKYKEEYANLLKKLISIKTGK